MTVCSNIINCDIDSCRILNSTMVNVLNLTSNHVEDSSIAYSASISNCTIGVSNLMSVVNVRNSSITTSSSLTVVANIRGAGTIPEAVAIDLLSCQVVHR